MLSYYLTFWHIYRSKNVDYVHVILPVQVKGELTVFELEDTLYTLRESTLLEITEDQIKKDILLTALLRDGESLVAKMQKHLHKKDKNNEIR